MSDDLPLWRLDPTVTFLNHGSFGACPRPVLEQQRAWQDELEAQPLRFFLRRYLPALNEARAQLADFLGARHEDLVFVTNATEGVNVVLQSVPLEAGDEILILDHAYGACRNAALRVAKLRGARVVEAHIPFPIASPEIAVQAVRDAITPRTRLAMIDHITSSTGLVMPLEAILDELHQRDVDVLVDGAHGPGQVPLNLDALGAAYYTGNCHKWLCAPKGAAFLHVRRDRHEDVWPLSTSHGVALPSSPRSWLHRAFDWPGTHDPSAWLCVPTAIDLLAQQLDGGWPAIRRRNHALLLQARDLLCDTLQIPAPAPDDMLGFMAAMPLPDGHTFTVHNELTAGPLHDTLLDEWNIEVPIVPWRAQPQRLVRVSTHLYNSLPQYQRLAEALKALL